MNKSFLEQGLGGAQAGLYKQSLEQQPPILLQNLVMSGVEIVIIAMRVLSVTSKWCYKALVEYR